MPKLLRYVVMIIILLFVVGIITIVLVGGILAFRMNAIAGILLTICGIWLIIMLIKEIKKNLEEEDEREL